MKRRIKRIVLAIFAAFILIFIPSRLLSFQIMAEGTSTYDPSNRDVVVSMVGLNADFSENTTTPLVEADSLGYVRFKFTTSLLKDGESIRVYYRTRDVSASAQAGDYEYTNSSFLMTKDNYNSNRVRDTVAIHTSESKYSVSTSNPSYGYDSTGYDSKKLQRYFEVEIYKLVTTGVNATWDGNVLRCGGRTTYAFNGYAPFDQLTYGVESKTTYNYLIEGTTTIDETTVYTFNAPAYLKTSYLSLVESGLISFQMRPWWESIYTRQSWPGRYCTVSVYEEGNIDFPLYYERIAYDGKDHPSGWEFYNIKETGCLRLEPYLGNDFFRINGLMVATKVADTAAPKITGWYLDKSAVENGGQLRLMVRYSEPVMLYLDRGDSRAITGHISNSNQSNVNGQDVKFEYYGGNGSDTLCYTLDINSETFGHQIYNKLEIYGINSIESIRDLNTQYVYNYYSLEYGAIYKTEFSPDALGSDLSFYLDTRNPNIALSATDAGIAVKNRTFGLEVTNISAQGTKIEWAVTTSSEKPDIYTEEFNDLLDKKIVVGGSGYNGEYYVHVRVTTSFGNVVEQTFGRSNERGYLFDNAPPIIENVSIENAIEESKKLNNKYYASFDITDLPNQNNDALSKVNLLISPVPFESVENSNDIRRITIYDQNLTKNALSINGNKATLTIDSSLLGSETEFGYYYLGFEASDAYENVTQLDDTFSKRIWFDSRDSIESAVEASTTPLYSENECIVYENTTVFTVNIPDIVTAASVSLLIRRDKLETIIDKLLDGDIQLNDFNIEVERINNSMTITFISNGKNGYYEFSLASGSTTVSNFEFYLASKDKNDLTYNLSNSSSSVFTNQIYSLNNLNYYYLVTENNTNVVKTTTYNDSKLSQVFSSKSAAYDYVYFYEQQDLYLYTINTSADATNMNNGLGNYRRANGEREAKAGQTWIRYKRSTWNNSNNTNDWVYYYYSDSKETTINPSLYSTSLLYALATVSERISLDGAYSYLVEEGNLDSNGAPTLSPTQIHPTKEEKNKTLTNVSFAPAIVYYGDEKIYESFLTEDGDETLYLLATNFTPIIGLTTRIFYRSKTDGGEYTEMILSNVRLADLVSSSGIYDIMEIDNYGMRILSVYVDKDAPKFDITYVNSSDGTENHATIIKDKYANTTFRVTAFSIESLSDIDSFAYIAVYNSNRKLITVLYGDDFNSSYKFNSGRYYLDISDRSGNTYIINLQINKEKINYKTVSLKNEYVRFTCETEAENVYAFEVYLGSKLLSTTYSKTLTFTESGTYTFILEDVFGNRIEEEVILERDNPEVSWNYFNNNEWVAYDESVKTGMQIISDPSGGRYLIYSSGDVQFLFETSKNYGFEFTENVEYTTTEMLLRTRVSIYANSWTVKVYYKDYPSIYSIYYCIVDRDAPEITGGIENTDLTYQDLEYMINHPGGSQLPPGIGFTPSGEETSLIHFNANSSVSANSITINLRDQSTIVYYKVLLDDVVIFEEENEQGIPNSFKLNGTGNYKIIARDFLGNESSFEFTNTTPTNFSYSVDNIVQAIDFDSLKHFSGDYLYDKEEYGNSSILFKYSGTNIISFYIQANNSTFYVNYLIEKGVISAFVYDASAENKDNNMKDFIEIFNKNNVAENQWVLIEDFDGLLLEISYSSNDYYFRLTIQDSTDIYTVQQRVKSEDNYIPIFTKTLISKMKVELDFFDENDDKIGSAETVYTNKDFYAISDNWNLILDIKYSYDSAGNFGNYQAYEQDTVFSEDGFYRFVIINIFGNKSEYTVIVSRDFLVVYSAVYSDGANNNYSMEYDSTILSNGKIQILAFSTDITWRILLNGNPVDPVEIKSENSTILELSEIGLYYIEIHDKAGNTRIINGQIRHSSYELDEEILTGFNENAILKDEGYTNQKITIDEKVLAESSAKYVAYIFNDTLTVLYDLISENKMDDLSILKDAIGKDGNGQYTVIFRDEFGTMISRVVNYSSDTTLSLYQMTRSDLEKKGYDLSVALENGLYSNLSVYLETSSIAYLLRIDGVKRECPLTLTYPADSSAGSYEYTAFYCDEYGNQYTFEIILIRQEIEISYSMSTTTIDSLLTTNKNIAIDYEDGFIATYEYNGKVYEYTKGTQLKKDGVYRFIVSDYAGNSTSLNIKRDTIVEFKFVAQQTSKLLQNGDVSSDGRVQFMNLNEDSAVIERAYLNGVLIDIKDNSFTDNGKWEFILSDAVGNKQYYSFYIIEHDLSSFSYQTPYNFIITKLIYDNGDGIKTSYMEFVVQNESNSEINLKENGVYEVTMYSLATNQTSVFSIRIDNTAPVVKLVGCELNSTTNNNVTLTGCKVGDVIQIYKDDKLQRTITVNSETFTFPEITEEGYYKIVVKNVAGNETVLQFNRAYTANTAASVLIISVLGGVAVVLFIGLLARKREKVE